MLLYSSVFIKFSESQSNDTKTTALLLASAVTELSLRGLNITSEHWCFKVLYWWFSEIFRYLRPHHYDKKPLLFQVLLSKGKPRIKVSIGFYYCKSYIKNTKLFKLQWVSQINFPKIFHHNNNDNNHDSYSLIQLQLKIFVRDTDAVRNPHKKAHISLAFLLWFVWPNSKQV